MKGKRKILPVIVFGCSIVILLFMVGYLRRNQRIQVIIAKTDILLDTQITEANVDEFITYEYRSSSEIKKEVISDQKEFINMRSINDIKVGSVLGLSDFVKVDTWIEELDDPVIMGLKASDMSQFISGQIQVGDYVDISILDNTTFDVYDVIRNVYVSGVYNSDGTPTQNGEGTMMINIVVEKEKETYINSLLQLGSLRLCKVGGYNE